MANVMCDIMRQCSLGPASLQGGQLVRGFALSRLDNESIIIDCRCARQDDPMTPVNFRLCRIGTWSVTARLSPRRPCIVLAGIATKVRVYSCNACLVSCRIVRRSSRNVMHNLRCVCVWGGGYVWNKKSAGTLVDLYCAIGTR